MTEPSRFYRQHVEVEAPVIDLFAFRPFWKVRTRLDHLLADKAISWAQWRAAQQFRAIVEAVRAASWPGGRGFDPPDHHGGRGDLAIIRRIDALGPYSVIRRQLGARPVDVLEAVIVDDERWTTIAARFRVHPKTVRRWAIDYIRALTQLL